MAFFGDKFDINEFFEAEENKMLIQIEKTYTKKSYSIVLFIRFEWFTPQLIIICFVYCINVICRHLFRVGQMLDSHIDLRRF